MVTNKSKLRTVGDPQVESATVSRMEITPSIAADWIARNTRNRPVRQAMVMRYSEDMAARRWRVNGSTVVMSDKGNILDGQHRLLACIRSGASFTTFVASGVPEEAFVTIDSGISRKFSDVVSILGYPDASRLSALVRGWWEYQERGKLGTTGKERAPTTQELQTMLLENTDRFLSCLRGTSGPQKLFGGGTGAWGVVWMATGDIDETDRDFFFDRLKDGQNLAAGDAIYALRRLLQNDETRGRAMPPNMLLAYLIKAWNKFRGRETVEILAVKASEDMPKPI